MTRQERVDEIMSIVVSAMNLLEALPQSSENKMKATNYIVVAAVEIFDILMKDRV